MIASNFVIDSSVTSHKREMTSSAIFCHFSGGVNDNLAAHKENKKVTAYEEIIINTLTWS